ncbi:hypothetical protein [Arthrobacter crystallopoietes]|uniref:hypothetical protein n=1 Tax=Crystallibacter crystallopoietes TaxID=37928 RepID=UPI000943F0BB|nr:hypothetical protein [Arthrobacter crystallopoietes]AUI52834.1 hypothetical protein AC20117_20570 [Arthrobacter crystallopoietes]
MTTAVEKAPWLTGIALLPETPDGIALSTDADLLGSASVRLASLSLVQLARASESSLAVPMGPVGEQKHFQAPLSIRAREFAGSLHVDLELPRQAAGDKTDEPASWEEVPSGAHILLVDTHIMGRAEMHISCLRFRYV